MKKIAILFVLLIIQLTATRAQTIISLDSAKTKGYRIVVKGRQSVDTLTARIIINTFIFYSVQINYKAISIDYLSKALAIISEYSPDFDNMKAVINEKEKEISLKDKTLLENNIKTAFPELQEYSAWNCIKFLLKNYNKFPVYLKNETITRVLFGTFERENDDGLFKLINCNIEKNKCFDTIAPMFDHYVFTSSDYIVYNGQRYEVIDFIVQTMECNDEFYKHLKIAYSKGYILPDADKIDCE